MSAKIMLNLQRQLNMKHELYVGQVMKLQSAVVQPGN